MNQKYAILVRKLTREELEEVMREGFSFDDDCEITICSTSNPRTHILYLPETLKAWQFAESYLYLVTEEKAKNADIIGWMNTDDTIFGVQPGEHLALRMVNDEGSILPIFVNRYNTCYIENFIEDDYDEKKMTREEKAFFDEKEGTILHHTTKYTTTFVPCKLPETTYEEVISFSGDFNKNENNEYEGSLDILVTSVNLFDKLGNYFSRYLGDWVGEIIAFIIFLAVIFAIMIICVILYRDTILPFTTKAIFVITTTILIAFIIATRIKKKLESPKNLLYLMYKNIIISFVYALILGIALLGINALVHGKEKYQKVEIVNNEKINSKNGYYYEVDITMPIYPYNYTIAMGEDGSFSVGTSAVLYYHTGCLGINFIDGLRHK